MPFSFLHISDLHFDKELSSDERFRKNMKEIIIQKGLNADCLIISGDLFNRGKLDEDEAEKLEVFLADIPGRQHTVVVPGNHDLDRSAQKAKDGSYNVFLTRRERVRNKGDLAAKEQFEIEEDEKEILYKDAFGAFFNFSNSMKFTSFNHNPELKAEYYEVQMPESLCVRDFPCEIKFVLLNTGLIAGQAIRGDDYRKKRKDLKDEIELAKANDDVIGAAKKQVELAEQQERYVNDGELIIDEDAPENEKNAGRLSLSKAGIKVLDDIQATDTELTIFVGHHGYQYLSAQTQLSLKDAMKKRRSGIYLCGHAHRAKYRRFLIGNNTTPRDIDQIQAGVMFKDEEGDTQYGFNHGVFVVNEYNKIECKVTSYYLIKSASDDLRWMSETIKVPLDGIKLPPQDKTCANVRLPDHHDDEKRENIVDPTET